MGKMQFKILVDSNFLVALSKEDDSLHKQALKVKARLKKERVKIVISNLIFIETVTVLSMRAGRKIAINAGEDLLSRNGIDIIRIGSEVELSAWEIFKDVKKKNMSFVDCSSIAVMQAEGINKFLTFDEEDFSPLRKKYSFSFY